MAGIIKIALFFSCYFVIHSVTSYLIRAVPVGHQRGVGYNESSVLPLDMKNVRVAPPKVLQRDVKNSNKYKALRCTWRICTYQTLVYL